MHLVITIISILVFFTIFFSRHDLQKVMLWTGSLSFPLFLLKFILVPNLFNKVSNTDLYFLFLVEAAVFGFAFGGIAAVLFEILFHQKLKIVAHPHRHHLSWLIFGPLVFFGSYFILDLSFAICIFFGFLTQALILLFMRKDLLWDSLVSGIFLSLVYVIYYYLFFSVVPGQISTIWLTDLTGIIIFGLPVEELLAIFAFGLLWGPLYEGTKGYVLEEIKQ